MSYDNEQFIPSRHRGMSGDVGAEVAAVLCAHHARHRIVGSGVRIEHLAPGEATPCASCRAAARALAPLIAERVEAARAEALREAAAHGVAWQDRLNIVCLCGAVCSAIVKRSPAPLMGTTSDDYVAAPAAEAFARHLRKARATALDPEATP